MAFRFETLNIWRQARTVSATVYSVTDRFLRHDADGLSSQLNRASTSIALLIAEGSALPTNPLFHHRLGLAQGEIAEVVCGVFLALDRGYLEVSRHGAIYESSQSLARQLDSLRETLRSALRSSSSLDRAY